MKGGGIKGLAYVGALKELERYYDFYWFVGTSAGAIAAVLLAAGYTTGELEEILSQTNFKKFLDAPPYKLPTNLYLYRGCYPGNSITEWVNDLLTSKLAGRSRGVGETSLRQLPGRVTIYASRRDQDVLEFDSASPETWNNPVAYAVRCSMAIPYIFQPPSHQGGDVFDGGMQNNYPVDIFLRNYPGTKFVGLYLQPEKSSKDKRRSSILSQMISIWTESADIRSLKAHIKDTVIIDPRPIGTLQFGLLEPEKDFLLKEGRAAALAFLAEQELPDRPSKALVDEAAKEAEAARELVYRARRRRRRNRRVVALLTLALIAGAVVARTLLRPNFVNSVTELMNGSTRERPAVIPAPAPPTPSVTPTPDTAPSNNQPDASPKPTPAEPREKRPNVSASRVAQHLNRARSLYANGRYQAAINECNKALLMDPGNREALSLRQQIQKTIDILDQ